ncbi:MAG: nucleotidyltransferase family protein [Chloroflexi bacterium]|nr:nucleotidyltransferase family protein [Chloroflexota bacterium]
MCGTHPAELLVEHREEVLRIAARYGASRVRVFGSVARREAEVTSDIDLLVALEPGRSLLDLGGLVYDLEQLLGRRVDVVTDGALQGRFRGNVLRDAIPIEEVTA